MTAHALSRAEPESVGFSSARLRRIGEALRREVADGQIPGAVVGIMRGGKLAHLEAVGYRDAAAREPLGTDAIFSVASMTKPMTSVAAMLLVEEGRLLLGDQVAKYLPPLAALKVAQDGGRVEGACAEAGADHPGPAAPHVGADLQRARQHAGAQGLPRLVDRHGRADGQGRCDRRAGQGAAAVRSGQRLGVRLLQRCAGLRRRGGGRHAARRFSGSAPVVAAGHERYQLRPAGGQAPPLRPGIGQGPADRGRQSGHPSRHRQDPALALGRRRRGLDGRRLPAFLRDAALGRTARVRRHPRSRHGDTR